MDIKKGAVKNSREVFNGANIYRNPAAVLSADKK
jgi:hypothetical protein